MQITVVGCGAVGRLITAAISSTGTPVTLLCIRRSSTEEVASEGIRVRGEGLESIVRVKAFTLSRLNSSKTSTVIVAVNTDSLSIVDRYLADIREVYFVQPTLSLADRLGREGNGLVALYTCAWIEEASLTYVPARVRVTKGYASDVLAEGFSRLGFHVDTYAPSRAISLLWDYIAAHASTQPVAAITGLTLSKLAASRYAKELVELLAREAAAVAEAHNVELLRNPVEAASEMLNIRGCRPKMLVDLEKGRKTEIDYINGWIIREALRANITPVYNEAVYLIVKALEDAMYTRGLGVFN